MMLPNADRCSFCHEETNPEFCFLARFSCSGQDSQMAQLHLRAEVSRRNNTSYFSTKLLFHYGLALIYIIFYIHFLGHVSSCEESHTWDRGRGGYLSWEWQTRTDGATLFAFLRVSLFSFAVFFFSLLRTDGELEIWM